MGIFDDIRTKGAAYRLNEEALFAEALREIESGQRRDGIWAQAMAESDMDQGKAGAKYIKLRVQSLKDEVTMLINAAVQKAAANDQKRIEQARHAQVVRQANPVKALPKNDGPSIKKLKYLWNGILVILAITVLVLMFSGIVTVILRLLN